MGVFQGTGEIRNKMLHERKNKEREEQKDSVAQWKKLESESQSVPVHWLRRSVSGRTRNDLEILFHGNSWE